MAKRVVIFSDTHCGSVFGLLPPDFLDSHEHEISQNPGQRYLWECWLDFAARVKKFKPDVIVANGDLVDGKQRMQEAEELILNLPLDQEEAAVQTCRILRNACPSAQWFFVAGTEYHDGRTARSLENVASRLEAVKYPGVGSGRLCREVLDLDIDGAILNVAHHISGGGGIYRATALDREAIWSALAGKEGKSPKADILVRSHVHYFAHVEHASKHAFNCPCWELQTRFMRKRSVYKMLPDIGGLFLTIDGEAKKAGDDPCVCQKVLYKLPLEKAHKL